MFKNKVKIISLLIPVSMVVFLFQNAVLVQNSAIVSSNMCLAELGANFNLGPETYRTFLIDRSGTRWMRAIIDLNRLRDERRDGIYGTTAPRAKMKLRLDSIKRAKLDGLNIIVSLKAEFKEYQLHIPDVDSDREKEMFNQVTFAISELGEAIDILVSGNEPIVETLDSDMVFNVTKNVNPMSSFYIRMAEHSNRLLRKLNLRESTRLYMGSFNRLDSVAKRSIPGVQDLLQYALNTNFVDGIDLHIHVPSMQAFEQQLSYTRSLIGNSDKGLIVSEFSLMWLFKQNLTTALCFGEGQPGVDFCDRLRAESVLGRELLERRGTATELEFINTFLKAPASQKLSKELFNEYFRSRAYLPANFMGEANQLFNQYGVRVATYTFDQDNPNDPETWAWSREYDAEDTPNRVYALFVPQMVMSEPIIRSNMYFYNPFKKAVLDSNARIVEQPHCANY